MGRDTMDQTDRSRTNKDAAVYVSIVALNMYILVEERRSVLPMALVNVRSYPEHGACQPNTRVFGSRTKSVTTNLAYETYGHKY
jgi:hypothetical protein